MQLASKLSMNLARRTAQPACRLVAGGSWTVRPVRSPLAVRASAEPTTASQASTSKPSTPVEYIADEEVALSKISFGAILTPIGVFLLTYGFGAFFQLLPGADVSSVMLIYGFPIAVLGFALSYAQLEPVKCRTTKEAFDMRESQCTDIQKQIREDTTRFRYGDEQHLEEALDKIFKFGRQGGIPRKLAPKLTGLREEVVEGAYTLTLEFVAPKDLAREKWELCLPKFQSFFGPGVIAQLQPTEQGMDVPLICDGSGAGRGGGEKKDVLPPLMPGLKARQQ